MEGLIFLRTETLKAFWKEKPMTPTGKNILALLVDLLADQEGIQITYELKEGAA